MENETLMTLVNECEQIKQPYEKEMSALDKASELDKLGFKEVASTMFKEIEKKSRLARISEFCYIKITEIKIREFLQRKVDAYNKIHPQEKKKNDNGIDYATGWVSVSSNNLNANYVFYSNGTLSISPTPIIKKREIPSISIQTNDYNKTTKDTIGQFLWKEIDIADYKTIPPQNVLQTLAIHRGRNLFDYFTIASVEHIPDPLLLGRIEDCQDRFFIAQWGDDIQLDDII